MWGLITAFMGKRASTQNIINDLQSKELALLQEEIVKEEIKPMDFQMIDRIDHDVPLNKEFSGKEFLTALGQCKTTSAPGIDPISYDILKKISNGQLEKIRKTFNQCFLDPQFPEEWRTALVKFMPKQNNKGFRPISLTSTLGKLMERMVKRRLEHFVEFHDMIPRSQFGFRKGKSAID